MNKTGNEKAQASGKGLNQNFIVADSKNKGFDLFDYRHNRNFGQCIKCGSDYMKFHVNGFCQDCQQRVEFIIREQPQVLRKVGISQQGAVA